MSTYLDFKFPKYDNNGNCLGDTIFFILKKNNVRKENQESTQTENFTNTKWRIDKILNKGKEIKLDSYHRIFNLRFNSDFTFIQQFGDNKYDCSTKSMDQNIEVGMEGGFREYFEYRNKIQGHYLSVKKGVWRIEKNNIILVDIDTKKVLLLSIEKSKNEEEYLFFDQLDYKIKMKEASH